MASSSGAAAQPPAPHENESEDYPDGPLPHYRNVDPGRGLDHAAEPVTSITAMFDTIFRTATNETEDPKKKPDFKDLVSHKQRWNLTVATVCSGTEAPLT